MNSAETLILTFITATGTFSCCESDTKWKNIPVTFHNDNDKYCTASISDW